MLMADAPQEPKPPPKTSAAGDLLPCIVLAWFGAIISSVLLQDHSEIRLLFCPSRAGCEAVLSSRYASLLGVPLPWVGAAYFLSILGFLLFALGCRSDVLRNRLASLVVWLAVAGLAFSGALMWVQFGILHAFCALCTASAVVVVLLVITGLRAERRLASAVGAGAPATAWALFCCTLLATLGLALPSVLSRDEVVAVVDGRKFMRSQMEAALAGGLQSHRRSIYELEFAWVKSQVNAALLDSEARRRGVTVERLLAAKPVTDELLAEIAVHHQIEFLLPKPPLRNLQFDLSKAHVTGPADAKVQLVVFSDFQCEYCARLAPVLQKIREEFPQDVLVAWRPFPLESKPRAWPAAVAAECAAEQGAFWEYHDRLFTDGGDLSDERLAVLATGLGLDVEKFARCRSSDEVRKKVQASFDDAVSLGIEGAPTLFFNGTMIGGYVEHDALVRRIRQALEKR